MRLSRRLAAVALALAGFVLVAGCGATVSNTGFVGTWQRASGAESKFSLRPTEAGLVWNWSMDIGARKVRCDGAGSCEEFQGEKKIYDYHFQVEEREEAPGSIFVRCDAMPATPESVELHYVDRLDLQPDGLSIGSYMVEMNGEPLAEPKGPVVFNKISDVPL
jgi:hypothetical protein